MNTSHITSLGRDKPVRPPGTELLRLAVERGSSQEAATVLGLDEGDAWNSLVAANNLADEPLFRFRKDALAPTGFALRVLAREEELASSFLRFLESPVREGFHGFNRRHQFLQHLVARTSARNQFVCRVHAIRLERINAVVDLDLGQGNLLAAHITRQSVQDLGLVWGRRCHALIDPGWVEVLPDRSSQGFRSNCLPGQVVRCVDDPVDGEVAIELTSGRIVLATLSRAERAAKGIHAGSQVQVHIQSSQIILAVDGGAGPVSGEV